MKGRGKRLGILVGLATAALASWWMLFRPEPLPVTVVRLERGLVESTVTNSKAGTVRSRLRSQLSPEIGGRVAAIAAREGDLVRTGQPIVRLDDAELKARVELEEQALEAAGAARVEACERRDQAERDLRRYRRLAESQVVSQELLDQIRTDRDAAAARCNAARSEERRAAAALRLARVQLARTIIRAPFDGVVSELRTEVGEYVSPSPPGLFIPPVVEVLRPDDVYVRAPLDEVDAARVRVGLPVRIRLEAYPDQTFPGTVRRVAPYIEDREEQSRTFDVDVDFAEGTRPSVTPPGMSADVEVILESRDDVLRLPAHALIEGNRALVVERDRLVARRLETGLRNWEYVEVRSGLEEGELVVVSLDRPEVRAGAHVRIEEVQNP